jgi:hypothetical protein
MRDDGATTESVAVLPGQVWLIEHDPETALSAIDRDALAEANVVLYDRALAPLLSEILPLGGYAEPLPLAGAILSPRARDLAAEGWSVVQLVAATTARRGCLHIASSRANGLVAPPSARGHAFTAHAFTANGLAG